MTADKVLRSILNDFFWCTSWALFIGTLGNFIFPLITRTTTHLSWESLVVNQVLWSAIVFASKMKMELLKSVLVTLQGTATEFSAPLWAVDVENRRMAAIKQLSSYSATWVVKTDFEIRIAFLLHFLCLNVDRWLKLPGALWEDLGPVCWAWSWWKEILAVSGYSKYTNGLGKENIPLFTFVL